MFHHLQGQDPLTSSALNDPGLRSRAESKTKIQVYLCPLTYVWLNLNQQSEFHSRNDSLSVEILFSKMKLTPTNQAKLRNEISDLRTNSSKIGADVSNPDYFTTFSELSWF